MTPAIGIAQTVPVAGDVAANVAQHLRSIEAAARLGARILVFPELSLTGYELERASDLAMATDDPRLDPLRDAAARAQLTAVVGAPVRPLRPVHEGERDTRPYLAALALGPDGSTQLYTKQHLGAFGPDVNPGGPIPPREDSAFVAGDANPLLDVDGWRAALAICADTGRPAHPERAAGCGADGYLASMFVIPADLEPETERFAGYAARHSLTIAMANYGGQTGGLPSAGCSSIWAAGGERVARLDPSGCAVAVATPRGDGAWTVAAARVD